MILKSMT